MLSAIYLLRGLRSLGGDCCLGTNFYLSMVFMISRASEGLNFSLCLGLIWYSLTALANVSFGIQFYYLKFIITKFNLQLNFIFQILFKLMSKRKVLPQTIKTSKRISLNSHIHSTSRHQLKPMESFQMEEENKYNLDNIKLKFLINKLIKKIKFFTPPNINSTNVRQTWENDHDQDQQMGNPKASQQYTKQTLSEQLSHRYEIIKYFQIIEGVFVLLFCWYITVSVTFQVELGFQIPLIMMIFVIIQLAVKLKIIKDDQQKEITYEIDQKQDFVYPIMLIIGCVFMILVNIVHLGEFKYIIVIYQMICVYIHWKRIGRYFQSITRYAEHNKMRKQLRIVQLFCFTLVMAHIFGILMFSITYLCPNGKTTWVQKANLTGQPWYILYIYSYYWANTTMVTVGYGDITPSNFVQAIFVTIVQVVGTAVFGYMINVIGITVNQIQKKNLQFQQSIGTIHKLQKHYKLTRQLCYKMKKDIIKKQIEENQTPLKNNEQKQFLQHIDDSLREQFVLETNMKVIKKTIFFLTHFTINFQNQIALKLIRCIYKPQEIISLEQNGEKQLTIINNGKVNIYCQYNHHNIEKKVLCKTIEPVEDQVSLNLFGYSTLILNRNSKLKAITQDTTTVYILKRNDVLESLHNSMLDFESFSELRQKFSYTKMIQQIQVPAINDIERHYLPNIYFIQNKIRKQNQLRLYTQRGKRKMNKRIVTLKHYKNKTILIIPQNKEQENIENYDSIQLINIDQYPTSIKNIQNNVKGPKQICIDQYKNFEMFMKRFNLNNISQKYEKFCIKKKFRSRSKGKRYYLRQSDRTSFKME